MDKSNVTLDITTGTNFDKMSMQDSHVKIPPAKIISDELFKNLYLLHPSVRIFLVPFGLWANFIVMRTFLRMGLADSVTFAFFALTVSDFCTMIISLLTIGLHIVSYLEAKLFFFFEVEPLVLNAYTQLIGTMFTLMSTFITTFLALKRCLCIVRPLQFKGMLTKKRTWYIICVFIPVSILPSALIYVSTVPKTRLDTFWNMSQFVLTYKPISRQTLIFIRTTYHMVIPSICQVIVSGCVILMGYELRASAKFRQSISKIKSQVETSLNAAHYGKQNKSKEGEGVLGSKERTAITQVTLISVIFLVPNSLKIVGTVFSYFVPEFSGGGLYKNLFNFIGSVQYTTDYINASVNFLVYYNFNSRFRSLCFNPKA